MKIAAVSGAFPPHYYDQEALLEAFKRLWGNRFFNATRLEQIHRKVLVGGRHLALDLEAYEKLQSFGEANDAFIECAVDLGERAIGDALSQAGLSVSDVDAIFFVSVTGIAVPSIDARLVNRMGLRRDIKRTPIYGLGCLAGTAGVARAADYLRAFPDHVAVLLSVELCSLTLQRRDISIPNIISSGLFGDGAAAVVMAGANRSTPGPRVLATRSSFYPQTEGAMGWKISEDGFRVVLSGDVPKLVTENARADADGFLADHGLALRDIDHFVCHPGGPKVLEALQTALELPAEALAGAWKSLRQVGNLSSASVLLVLADLLAKAPPDPGDRALMMSMGPGFCSELALLQW